MLQTDDLILETPRLRMQPIAAGDEEEWWQAIWCDAEVTRYLPPQAPLPRERMPRLMQRVAEQWSEHGLGTWSVREKSEGTFIGYCGLVLNEPPVVELVYALTRSAWGRGIASEAAGRMVDFAFRQRGMEHLTALVFPDNIASVRVLEKLGFVFQDETHRFNARLLRYGLSAE